MVEFEYKGGMEFKVALDWRMGMVLDEFCKWMELDFVEYVNKAVLQTLKTDLEELAGMDIPKAQRMFEELRRELKF